MKNIQSFVEYAKKFPPEIFWLVMLVILSSWMYFWNTVFWPDSEYVLTEPTLYLEIIKQPGLVFVEELVWRLLPFTIVSILWLWGVHIKIPTILLVILTVVAIISIQIQFGLQHVLSDQALRAILELPQVPTSQEKLRQIVLQGGMGIILSCTYVKFLLSSRNLFKYVHALPLIACITLHTVSNVVVIIAMYR